MLDLILILLGGKRLDRHDLLPLGSTGEDAIALYGDPLETAEGDSLPESVKYTFGVSSFHDCVAWEWRG